MTWRWATEDRGQPTEARGDFRQSTCHELQAWLKSMDFVEDVYKALSKFPKEERYGICDQIRRAAVSIPSNIAEGFARGTTKDFINFLYIVKLLNEITKFSHKLESS